MLKLVARACAFMLHAILASAFHHLTSILLALLRPCHPALAALLAA